MKRVETPTAFAEDVAARLYGLRASAQRLPGEYDDNFLLTAGDGVRYVLKLMHPDRAPALIDMQVQALEFVAQQAPELRCSKVLPCRDGALHAVTEDAAGRKRLVWMLDYIEGRPYSETAPQTPALRRSLGAYVGRLDATLAAFTHPAAHQDLKWDSARAGWIAPHIGQVRDPARRALVEGFMRLYAERVVPAQEQVRHSVIQGDANETNTLTRAGANASPEVIAVIDFGDMHHGIRISGLAIAAAYAIFGTDDPLEAAADIVAGYHRVAPIPEDELPLILPLIAARLCVSVVNSRLRSALAPDDPYMTVSEAPAWQVLERLAQVTPEYAEARFRLACALPAVASGGALAAELAQRRAASPGLLEAELAKASVFDLSVGSLWLGADPAALEPAALARGIGRAMTEPACDVAISGSNEIRLDPQAANGGASWLQLGLDVFAAAGTIVRTPLAGTVQSLSLLGNEGASLVLRFELGSSHGYLVVSHLDDATSLPTVGARLAPGDLLGRISAKGTAALPLPHLRVALLAGLLGLRGAALLQAPANQRQLWNQVLLDPAVLLRLPVARDAHERRSVAAARECRGALLGSNLSLSYQRPLKIVRGWRQYLYDDEGRAYLDVFNNVPLVGHSHPRVVAAANRQLALLNTNTRYLHDNVLDYAERLTALMPAPLRVCYFLNSASEANELALRMARTVTGRKDVIVLEHAYHGNTSTLIEISPYKFNGRGGRGREPWVHVAPIPDDYRGAFRRVDPEAGKKYAAQVGEIIRTGVAPGAFIAETLPSVGGQVVLPPGYLSHAYQHVRAAGGLCIADEVQVGFGRLGEHFWGFESQQVVPDMVVLGKPIGNAFPLAALVTTPEIAARFDNGMEFFSTFGGNPVACAAGIAVLDVLRDEQLPGNAQAMGRRLIEGLCALKERHPLVGDVRGLGLFLGVELVCDRQSLEPATAEAGYVVNRLREEGILAGTDGPHHNVLKIRPPLCIGAADAGRFVAVLDRVLGEDGLRR